MKNTIKPDLKGKSVVDTIESKSRSVITKRSSNGETFHAKGFGHHGNINKALEKATQKSASSQASKQLTQKAHSSNSMVKTACSYKDRNQKTAKKEPTKT